ncbi:retrovirus-related pol polyprotein from transposon TNT 1-94, partial [Tanacetum coccineum]
LPKIDETHALSKPVTSNSVPTLQESKVVKNDNVIAPGMFMINPFKPSREEKYVPNKVRARIRTNPITVSQPHVITKKDVNSDSNDLSSTRNDKSEVVCANGNNVKLDLKGKIIASSESESQSDCSNGYPNLFMVHRLGLFQAYDRDSKASHQLRLEVFGNYLEVTFRRNTCFVRNLKGVDLLKGNRTTNLYTINLHEMASTSPICLMARATSTKSWLWHQRLSHLNFDTINDLAKNDLVTGLPKFKYHKEHLCPSCEQGKSKRASHPPKPVLNSKSKDKAPEVIKTFLKSTSGFSDADYVG